MKYYTREECAAMARNTAVSTPLYSHTDKDIENILVQMLGKRK